ncbi:MAG: type I methionyl aminopeptidase [Dehalococcoidia bacterium]|nr:type I methionyl aminopeptidase [Dehalococcoidia bacterium]MDZ4246961.1 type I methionyl aminopeptidase [Dehalococcoidia bacterium]
MGIIIKSENEITLMRQAGKIVARVLDKLTGLIKPGIKTQELDVIAEEEILRLGGIPSFKGYRSYPATLCVSINDEIVHGIPGNRVLKESDLVSLDVGAIYKGYQGDASITVGITPVSETGKRLLETTKGALAEGIRVARAGVHVGDLSNAIQSYVEKTGFYLVKEYSGHGIGANLHEDPQVPNVGVKGEGPVLYPGMTLAIEPMVNTGTWRTRIAKNMWTVLTADGGLSAHFEHTIVITKNGAEILTAL